MVHVIMNEYWSKADAFLLPLTGLLKNERYELSSYLFWEKNSIEDYKLILSFSYDDYYDFTEYCKSRIFPILDKKGYMLENYDIGGRSIFVLDMAEWAMDIEMFLVGKYSQFTRGTKQIIEQFHTFNGDKIPIHIYATLHPNMKMSLLTDNNIVLTPVEYVSKMYGFSLEVLNKIGEIGSLYEPGYETLYVDVESICQGDMKIDEV